MARSMQTASTGCWRRDRIDRGTTVLQEFEWASAFRVMTVQTNGLRDIQKQDEGIGRNGR